MVRGVCELCGAPVSGKSRFCEACKKLKQREYFKNRYNTDEAFRQKYLKYAENQRKKPQLGTLYDYSPHFCGDFDKEAQIVGNMKKKTLKQRRWAGEDKPNVHENYVNALSFEESKLESTKECELCGGTEFERIRGEIVCKSCGLVQPIWKMSSVPK